MTKSEIKYIFKELGVTLPDTGITESVDISSKIKRIVIGKRFLYKDSERSRYQFDMTNELLIQTRLNPKGNTIKRFRANSSDPVVDCRNVFNFKDILFIVPEDK